MTRRSGLTYVEVLIVIVLIIVGIAFLIPLLHRGHRGEGSGRVKCASNLRQIGQALLIYANDHKGHYPRGIYVTGTQAIPTWGTRADVSNPFSADGPVNDVTAALYLLLRTTEITPEVFTCPYSQQETWDFGGKGRTAMSWSNFVDIKKHLSYSLHNPYANDEAVKRGATWTNSISAEFAVAADMNPGLTNGAINVMTVTTTSSAKEMKGGNSVNHERDGQNILYGDGHVGFEQHPFVGVQRDNIYTTKLASTGFTGGSFIAPPYDAGDSILLPTSQ
jgi:prepilin-type processing-associated H-X9-DG protein